MPKTLVIAHRGDSQFAPENLIPAFASAVAKGADAIEFDVHLTKDNQLVVHHDYYLGRTENGRGFIGDYSLAELQALDIGGWFSEDFKNEKMPTLSNVLDIGKGKTRFEIELRCPTLPFLEKVIGEINRFGVANDVEITSPHIPLLHYVKKINVGLRSGIFFNSYPGWMDAALGQQHIIDWMRLVDAQVVHIPHQLIERKFIENLHEHNFIVHGANLEDMDEMKVAISKGIDQFSTDKLELAIEVRDTLMSSTT